MALDQVDVDKLTLESDVEEKEMTFLEHLEELRWHIIRSIVAIVIFGIVVFIAKDFVFNSIIFAPKYDWFISYKAICSLSVWLGLGSNLCLQPPDFDILATQFGERFVVHVKVAIIMGFIASFPYIFWEMWRFIRPGLYENERKAAQGVVFICSSLFLMGVLFGYFVISPFAVTFLAGYDITDVQSTTSLSSFVNYMTMFTLPTGIVFELPVVVYFFTKIGLIGPDFLRTYRKHAFIIILIMAAIITPPDVVTQFLIGVPLYFLYEVSIIISKRVERQQQESD